MLGRSSPPSWKQKAGNQQSKPHQPQARLTKKEASKVGKIVRDKPHPSTGCLVNWALCRVVLTSFMRDQAPALLFQKSATCQAVLCLVARTFTLRLSLRFKVET